MGDDLWIVIRSSMTMNGHHHGGDVDYCDDDEENDYVDVVAPLVPGALGSSQTL